MRPKVRHTAVLLVALCMLAAMPGSPAGADAMWTTVQLSDDESADVQPCVDPEGGYVVWQGKDGADWDIFLYEVDQGEVVQLTHNSLDDLAPQVYGGCVVWRAVDASGSSDVMLHCISDDVTTVLGDPDSDDVECSIQDGRVVWIGHDTEYTVWTYDVAQETLDLVASDSGEMRHPRTDGEWVVWQAIPSASADDDWEIALWDGFEVMMLTENTVADEAPEVSDSEVVWQELAGGSYEIMFYSDAGLRQITDNSRADRDPLIDAGSGVTTLAWRSADGNDWEIVVATRPAASSSFRTSRVTDNSRDDLLGDLSGGLAWYGYDGRDWEIHYRTPGGAVEQITDDARDDRYPSTAPGLIAWQGGAGDASEIFLATLDAKGPTVTITSPAAGAVITGTTARITGTAKDDLAVESIEVRIGSSGWVEADISKGAGTANVTWYYDWALPAEDRVAHVVSARATDSSGNVGEAAVKPKVWVDTVAPVLSSFEIDGGSEVTQSRDVMLSYVVSDASTPLKMRFRNEDGAWSVWEPFTPAKSWTLSAGLGVKTVFFSFKDAVGNVSGNGDAGDTIRLVAGEFTDVAPDHPYREAIYVLRNAGIVSGYLMGDGTWQFRPAGMVYRAEFAKMIDGVMGITPTEDLTWPFTDLGPDVPDDLFPHEYIAAAFNAGITTGTGPTTFAPYNSIRRAQVVTMIVRAAQALSPGSLATPPTSYVGSIAPFDSVHDPYMRIAEYNGLLEGLYGFSPDWNPWTPASRGETAQMLFGLMETID